MKKIIEEILKLPYIDNKNYKHENTIKNIFIQNCLEEYKLQKKLNKKTFKEEVDRKLKNGEFIHQPLGSQNHPDFILKLNNKLYCFECKSCQQVYPVYNGGLPHKDSIYIFSSKDHNKTTVYYGSDIVSEEQRNRLFLLHEEIKSIVKKYQQISEWKEDPRGFDYYPRPMYTQSGTKSKKDYFTHKDKEKCERRILDEFADIPNIE